MQRTQKQNNSLHKFCELLAEAMDEAGIDMKTAVKAPIRPTKENVKETIVKVVMNALYPDVESTTQLTTKELQEVYENVNRFTGQLWGIHVPWPSIETQSEEQR